MALEAWAAQVVCEHLDAHVANLERATRLEEKAERLEKAGTPSESARNRAERARREVVAELAALRASFVEAAGGRGGAYAFDRMVEQVPDFHAASALGQASLKRSLGPLGSGSQGAEDIPSDPARLRTGPGVEKEKANSGQHQDQKYPP